MQLNTNRRKQIKMFKNSHQHSTATNGPPLATRHGQPAEKAFHCSMSQELQALHCVSQPNQQIVIVSVTFPDPVKELIKILKYPNCSSTNPVTKRKITTMYYRIYANAVHSSYISGHLGPWSLVESLSSSSYCTVNIFCITLGHMSYYFSGARIVGWKCFS